MPLARRCALWSRSGLLAPAWLSRRAWSDTSKRELQPVANAWSATVAALVAYQGLHVAVLVVMAAYLIARAWSERLAPDSRATLDNVVLLWHYSAAQGIVITLLVQWLPRIVN